MIADLNSVSAEICWFFLVFFLRSFHITVTNVMLDLLASDFLVRPKFAPSRNLAFDIAL